MTTTSAARRAARASPNRLSQNALDVRPDQPIRAPFERIFEEAASAAEKGRWFEHLFMAVAKDVPDFHVAEIGPWREWPDRSRLAGLDGRDVGIDLVAKLGGGALVAIQCKCYDRDHRVSKTCAGLKVFRLETSRAGFRHAWQARDYANRRRA